MLDRTTLTALTMPTEGEWLQLQLLRDTAENALKELVGLTEVAGSPFSDDAAFLAKTLAPDPHEQAANEFVATTWQLLAHGKFVMSVPGTLSIGKLEGE